MGVLIFLIFYLNPNRGHFLIYIYVLNKWKVKYKWRNGDIYLNGINGNKVNKPVIRVVDGNKVNKPIIRVVEAYLFRGPEANS